MNDDLVPNPPIAAPPSPVVTSLAQAKAAAAKTVRPLPVLKAHVLVDTSHVVGEISRVSGQRAIDPLAPPPA